jgi:hypothetical protein
MIQNQNVAPMGLTYLKPCLITKISDRYTFNKRLGYNKGN